MAHSHSTQDPKNVYLVLNINQLYTKQHAYNFLYTLMYIMYIFSIFFLVATTTRSAGTSKLGLYGNMEGGACTHNLTTTCISKSQWCNNHHTQTEREKIKSDSLIITHTTKHRGYTHLNKTMKKTPKNTK